MPATRDDMFQLFDELGIAHTTTSHRPIFTVAEGRDVKATLPGLHTKNLFLKSRKDGHLYLLCAEGDAEVRVNGLHRHLGCKRLSFGSAELLEEALGVTPGSVTLFALMNDTPEFGGDRRVTLLLDEKLADAELVNFHPLLNDATTAVSGADMLRFAEATGHNPVVLSRAVMRGDSESA